MLNEREAMMYKLLYQEGGTRLTKNGGVKVMQGRCLGGGTAVNWSACLPPRLETLQEWHNAEQAAYAAMRDGAQAVPATFTRRQNRRPRLAFAGCSPVAWNYDNPWITCQLEPILRGKMQSQP